MRGSGRRVASGPEGVMALSDPHSLQSLADWMRKNGVRRARCGELEVEFAREPQPPGQERERKPKTEEELKAVAHEARRRRYERELGRELTDDQLRQLP